MAKYIIASTKLNDDGTVHSVSHPIEVDSDTINTIKIFDKTYVKQEHGEWLIDKSKSLMCSKCGTLLDEFQKPSRYCPHCGAKMDGGEE